MFLVRFLLVLSIFWSWVVDHASFSSVDTAWFTNAHYSLQLLSSIYLSIIRCFIFKSTTRDRQKEKKRYSGAGHKLIMQFYLIHENIQTKTFYKILHCLYLKSFARPFVYRLFFNRRLTERTSLIPSASWNTVLHELVRLDALDQPSGSSLVLSDPRWPGGNDS